jgi:hypothetical protein
VEMTQSMNAVIHHYHFHIVTVQVMIEYREINLVSYMLIITYFEVCQIQIRRLTIRSIEV